jgi:hypothetical protein
MASRSQRPPPTSIPPGASRAGAIGSAPNALGSAAAAMGTLNLGSAKPPRPPPGMSASAKRAKPAGLTLDKIIGPPTPGSPPTMLNLRGAGGGTGGAGLGPGRALSIGSPPRRPQQSGTPFSNFSSIVYVACIPRTLLSFALTFQARTPSEIHRAPSTSRARQYYMPLASTFPMDLLSP